MTNLAGQVRLPSVLDIEASGFGAESYPIEVGVARDDGERYCRLIKPLDHWQHWDQQAEALHGISRSVLLDSGTDANQVCHELNAFLAGRRVYSDGWVVDHPWLIKLFTESRVRMQFTLSALDYILNEDQMQRWHTVKAVVESSLPEQRHRASTDASVIQQTYLQSARQKK